MPVGALVLIDNILTTCLMPAAPMRAGVPAGRPNMEGRYARSAPDTSLRRLASSCTPNSCRRACAGACSRCRGCAYRRHACQRQCCRPTRTGPTHSGGGADAPMPPLLQAPPWRQPACPTNCDPLERRMQHGQRAHRRHKIHPCMHASPHKKQAASTGRAGQWAAGPAHAAHTMPGVTSLKPPTTTRPSSRVLKYTYPPRA